MSDHKSEIKKAKKLAIFRRNRKNDIIQEQLRAAQREQERVEKLKEGMAPKHEEKTAEETLWSAKTQDIRDRLTGKKHQAQERWNRFAGTGDAGARGR